MPALVADIHVFGGEATSLVAMAAQQDVDGRDKPGHGDGWFCPVEAQQHPRFRQRECRLLRNVYNHVREKANATARETASSCAGIAT